MEIKPTRRRKRFGTKLVLFLALAAILLLAFAVPALGAEGSEGEATTVEATSAATAEESASHGGGEASLELPVLSDKELVDYCEHHAGTLATSPGRLNPYKLGIELLRDIERRWNTGRYGPEYDACDDMAVRREWGKDRAFS